VSHLKAITKRRMGRPPKPHKSAFAPPLGLSEAGVRQWDKRLLELGIKRNDLRLNRLATDTLVRITWLARYCIAYGKMGKGRGVAFHHGRLLSSVCGAHRALPSPPGSSARH
jgi:hypothetical protein